MYVITILHKVKMFLGNQIFIFLLELMLDHNNQFAKTVSSMHCNIRHQDQATQDYLGCKEEASISAFN